ncbi:hypothetical protein [Streptomyces sp. TP-A0874]|uniref:hypothetical protein n=1 Tax=Streptomyces sp. TP-A0874 TaxID=549819 RepID=UPI000852958A|nr:hypothetical protein [Streptomyces sp. TP-A0874]
MPDVGRAGRPEAEAPVPQVLCDTAALTADLSAPSGALWRLAESGRQLDSNLVHLPAHGLVGSHAEPDLDVLLLVVAGDGTLGTETSPVELRPGLLVWLPHGSTRDLRAGQAGLSYLTVHVRRPGMRIRSGPPPGATPPPPRG